MSFPGERSLERFIEESSKFHDGPKGPAASDVKSALIDAYSLTWSQDVMADIVRDRPDDALDMIVEMLAHAADERVISMLAAGPLEDVLAYHGDALIDRVESEADGNSRFKHALGDVWQNAMSDEVWERVKAAGPDPAHRPPGWAQRLAGNRTGVNRG